MREKFSANVGNIGNHPLSRTALDAVNARVYIGNSVFQAENHAV